MKDIEKIIKHANEENQEKINRTKAWSKKYPALATYTNKVDVEKYGKEIRNLLESLQEEYQYTELDAMLVLKDILYQEWKNQKKK